MGLLYHGFCYSETQKLIDAAYSYESVNFSASNRASTADTSATYSNLNYILLNTVNASAGLQINVTPVDCDIAGTTTLFWSCVTRPSLNVYFPLKTCSYNNDVIQPMNITLQNPPDNFNPSNLNPVDVFNSIGSGFLLVAVPLAVVWAGRHFLRPLFSK